MKIVDCICAKGRTGYFFDDQKAIKGGAAADGESYSGAPVTPGFTSVRQRGEAVSVMLILEDGQIAHGDCAAVQYSGAGGRDPLFLSDSYIPVIQKEIAPLIVGKDTNDYQELWDVLDKDFNGKKMHTAVRYGVSQAILDAAAKGRKKLMAEVVAETYNTTVSTKIIPIFCQSGDNRYLNVDKMILKEADVLPHALFNNVEEKLGRKGEKLLEYVGWLKNRIEKLRTDKSYHPLLHIDVYGTIGLAFDHNQDKILTYLKELKKEAGSFTLAIEGIVDVGERTAQMEFLAELTEKIDALGIGIKMVADEWCNTYEDVVYFADNQAGHIIQIKTPDLGGVNHTAEAVMYCKKKNIGAYQGGTCNETDRSSIVCANVAMGVGPDQVLAKPGMGVDEGFMITYNEMSRIAAIMNSRGA